MLNNPVIVLKSTRRYLAELRSRALIVGRFWSQADHLLCSRFIFTASTDRSRANFVIHAAVLSETLSAMTGCTRAYTHPLVHKSQYNLIEMTFCLYADAAFSGSVLTNIQGVSMTLLTLGRASTYKVDTQIFTFAF